MARVKGAGKLLAVAGLVSMVICGSLFAKQDVSQAASTREMLYITGYDATYAIDPVKREMVAKYSIKGPNRDFTWTGDGHRLFINSAQRQEVAIVDTIENKVVDTVSFNQPDQKITSRIYGLAVDPAGNKLYATLMRTQRKSAELIRLKPIIAVMDLQTKQVVKEIDAPVLAHTLQFLEDGKRLVVWAKDLYMLDTETDQMKKVEELMNPADPDKQGIASYLYLWTRDRDSANSITAGLVKFFPTSGNLEEHIFMMDRKTAEMKDYKLDTLLGLFSVVVSPDKKYAYGGENLIFKIDLKTGKAVKTLQSKVGTSYGYNISGDGKTVYVSGGGPDISFINAATMAYEKVLDLPSDTMDVHVVQIAQ